MRFKFFARLVITSGVGLAAAPTLHAQTYRQLYSFHGLHGAYPDAGLTEFQGKLYGTTVNGGGSGNCRGGCGAVFSIDIKTGDEKVVYSFQNGTDGSGPTSGLTVVKGLLFGTTAHGNQTVFSLDPSSGVETVVHNFDGANDGAGPSSALTEVAGVLYGETIGGSGNNGAGTVYSLDPVTGVEQVVYAFQGNLDGTVPTGGLLYVAGILYGTTVYGGAVGDGTVFSFNPNTGAETILHSFGKGHDGKDPGSALIQVGSKLYGTTHIGGAYTGGVVYSIDPNTGHEKVVHSFGSPGDASLEFGGLTDVSGILYGNSFEGGTGACDCGAIYSINAASGSETVVYSFQGRPADGGRPYDSLTGVGGTLYGTTGTGGLHNKGTVFALTP